MSTVCLLLLLLLLLHVAAAAAAGVAYHHAGLTHQERGVVEEGSRSGALLVLTATSTLAAGVNLPARRVILRSLWQGAGYVGRAQYLQMVGRAGRAGESWPGDRGAVRRPRVCVTANGCHQQQLMIVMSFACSFNISLAADVVGNNECSAAAVAGFYCWN
jgi:ATP-dependent helicase YprA (DUF1998 family)